MTFIRAILGSALLSVTIISFCNDSIVVNAKEYFEKPGFNIIVFNDDYAEGHQGGIQLIQHGNRIASNGDIWLEPAPGQWSPFSKLISREADSHNNTIAVKLCYPNDEAAQRKFNPIKYPDLNLNYTVKVQAEGNKFRIIVNLERPVPREFLGKVGFNLELYPGDLFEKSYQMDNRSGIFPRQLNGSFYPDSELPIPMDEGKQLVITPESEKTRIKISTEKNILQLIDGRAYHNNGWFILRSPVPAGATRNAIEWLIEPYIIENWTYKPVIHINQVGYLPKLAKRALIEYDTRENPKGTISLWKIEVDGSYTMVLQAPPVNPVNYQRYSYLNFDFSSVNDPGLYQISYDSIWSETFRIADNIYDRDVWQPVLEYFLPVQMCHMRVNDRYKVWHGLCHMDDAAMAPVDYVHFDGYVQGSSTLTRFATGEHVDGLNTGGWHDAGDFDLRVESQANTVYSLSLIYETFNVDYDITSIDQKNHNVEMHKPDGVEDILQQIEHGVLSIIGGYENLGLLYRGIISSNLRQYVTLGDPATMTNNIIYDPANNISLPEWIKNVQDDRLVFTEENTEHKFQTCKALAAASRVIVKYNPALAERCNEIAVELWEQEKEAPVTSQKIEACIELFITTGEAVYKDQLNSWETEIAKNIKDIGWTVSRIYDKTESPGFSRNYMLAMQKYFMDLKNETAQNPFGIPYKPSTWGWAWNAERFGIGQYFLYKNLHNTESKQNLINSLNYVLGIHPGENTASFVSGVGSKSAIIAYGLNRDDWSYIPGGVISGTAMIKPDFPELKEWPYLWQQTEYMISGAAEGFMFLVLAVKEISK